MPSKPKASKDKLNSLNEEYIHQITIEMEARECKKDILIQMVNEVLHEFESKESRDKLISDAKKTFYSEKKTKNIERVFEDGTFNQDNIKLNDIRDIIDAKKHIKQQKDKTGFLSRLANSVLPDR